MEPSRLRACEALVQSLAVDSKVVSLPSRSEQQEILNVAPYLIYMHGLLAKEPPYKPWQQEAFNDLQQIYEQSADKRGHRFCLSPSMRPSPSDWDRIQQDVAKKIEELEAEAVRSEKELVALANQEEEKEATKKKKPKKQRKSPQHPIIKESTAAPPSPSKKKTETLQQVLAQIQVPQHETETTGDPWVEVGKKSKVKPPNEPAENLIEADGEKSRAKTKKTSALARTQKSVDENEEPKFKASADGDKVGASFVDQDRQADQPYPEDPPQIVSQADNNLPNKQDNEKVTIPEKKPLPVEGEKLNGKPAIAVDQDNNNLTFQQLQLRILELEQALAQSEQKRIDQQQKHARELSKEREHADERLQALQLRLYISETRLKTYEDALQDHVNAVANNVAGGTASPDRLPKMDPETPSNGKRPWISKHAIV